MQAEVIIVNSVVEGISRHLNVFAEARGRQDALDSRPLRQKLWFGRKA